MEIIQHVMVLGLMIASVLLGMTIQEFITLYKHEKQREKEEKENTNQGASREN